MKSFGPLSTFFLIFWFNILEFTLANHCYCTTGVTPIVEDPKSGLLGVSTLPTCMNGLVDNEWLYLKDKNLYIPRDAVRLANPGECNQDNRLIIQYVSQAQDVEDKDIEIIESLKKRQASLLDHVYQYTAWTQWSTCSGECWDNGKVTRTRTCIDIKDLSTGVDSSLCSDTHFESKPCFLNCTAFPVAPWTTWSFCPTPCNGTTSRNRTCRLEADACSGQDLKQTLPCNASLCAVDGAWTDWGSWQACSKSSNKTDDAFRVRYRACSNPAPKNGGIECNGPTYKLEVCTSPLPVGEWGQWAEWSKCFLADNCTVQGNSFRMRMCPADTTCKGDDYEKQVCTKDGCFAGWELWSPWSNCSVTCGSGLNMRRRVCNTTSLNDTSTAQCDGEANESRNCSESLLECPIDGEYLEWSPWNSCSETCGTEGYKTRHRQCTTPKFGGNTCDSVKTSELEICNNSECPVDGAFSEWMEWSQCSSTCGAGIRSRDRKCNNPPAQYGGRECVGNSTNTQDCNETVCPVDGDWGAWNQWSECNCNHERLRHRECDNPKPVGTGSNCVGLNEATEHCDNVGASLNCPVDGGWSTWFPWSACTVTCGTGDITRSRACVNPRPAHGGKYCDGDYFETGSCNKSPCPVDGQWSQWGRWTNCDKTCDDGFMSRNRSCSDPQYGGKYCSGNSSETVDCKLRECPIDGDWSDWSEWSLCSVTCNTGNRERTRSCNNPEPKFGGKYCKGLNASHDTCTEIPCPVDGNWGPWGDFSACSVTCDKGNMTRHRMCDSPAPKYNGSSCAGNEMDIATCIPRPDCVVNGGWSEWSPWSDCDQTCGSGTRNRFHICDSPRPQNGGQICAGEYGETGACFEKHCPVDGNWAAWGAYTACSVTCSTGTKQRTRTCTNPPRNYGGLNCPGNSSDNDSCYERECPVDGNWGSWSDWGSCSVTCSDGVQDRNRTCDNPAPAHNGTYCSGDSVAQQNCTEKPCPVDGGWSDWKEWGVCSATCGYNGTRSRSRDCDNPKPDFGGRPCMEQTTMSEQCPNVCCPVQGGWGTWFGWSSCQVDGACPNGKRTRFRACNNPQPKCKGEFCNGDGRNHETCLPKECVTTADPNETTVTVPTTTTTVAHTTPVHTTPVHTTHATGHSTTPPLNFSCVVCAEKDFPDLCITYTTTQMCPEPYCVNEVTNYDTGDKIVDRRCGKISECKSAWWHTTSDNPDCTSYDENAQVKKSFHCTFCCVEENCNQNVRPDLNTLYNQNAHN